LSARSSVFGFPAQHFLGVVYNNARTNFSTFAAIPNVWNYGARGGQAGVISSYTSNIGLRAREEIALTNDLTAAIAFSANWNRVWGNSRYNSYANPPPGQPWNLRLVSPPFDIAVNNDYFNTAPEASLHYRYDPALAFRARYSVGYSTPSFDSLTASPTGAARANSALKAQTSMEAEGGVDWTPNKSLSVSATFFNAWFRNELVSQVSPYDNTINYMQNVPASLHRGFELGFDWRPVEGWRLFTAYTFYNFIFTNFQDRLALNAVYDRAGNVMPGQPAHTLTTRLGYDAPTGDFKGLGAFVEYNLRAASAMDNANFTWIPGYGLINVNLHYERDVNIGWIKSVSGYVEGRNMLDTVYAASAMPFTNQVNAAGAQLPGPLLATSGTIMPGAPRAVVAGMKFKF
jgi:iron complex outermembrane receptor protein